MFTIFKAKAKFSSKINMGQIYPNIRHLDTNTTTDNFLNLQKINDVTHG